ncbi:MAG: YdeI/OmpD-associated family protein [Bacteroidetes bacterium]|nr:YdeI/OmpD-associated family protein [Bacteroidota bacterium]
MIKIKHNSDAKSLIDDSISKAEPFAQTICKKLRAVIFTAEPNIIEDWKWGPNYYSNGMVCGFWYFKRHVSFVFFQGALLKDKYNVLQANPGNLHNRHLKFTDIKQVNEKILIAYIMEAVANNAKGIKITEAKDKTVIIPSDFKKLLSKNKLLPYFKNLAYSHRKEYVMWVNDAKKEETRLKRMDKAISKLTEKEGLNDKYLKKKTKN